MEVTVTSDIATDLDITHEALSSTCSPPVDAPIVYLTEPPLAVCVAQTKLYTVHASRQVLSTMA